MRDEEGEGVVKFILLSFSLLISTFQSPSPTMETGTTREPGSAGKGDVATVQV